MSRTTRRNNNNSEVLRQAISYKRHHRHDWYQKYQQYIGV